MQKNLFIIILISFCLQVSGQDIKYSKEQIREDLSFLQTQLQKYHPNLYVYTSKVELDNCFEQLRTSILDSLTKPESYSAITSTCSFVKDGHYIVNPSQQTLNQFYTNSKLLPVDIHWTEEDAYIIRNYSHTNIEIGSKISSINGIDINKIRKTILNGVLRDGHNITYPYWLLNNFGRAYYNFHFGSFNKYDIQIIDKSQKTITHSLKGMKGEKIVENRKSIYPLYYEKLNKEKGIHLKIDKHIAILTIKSLKTRHSKKHTIKNLEKPLKPALIL